MRIGLTDGPESRTARNNCYISFKTGLVVYFCAEYVSPNATMPDLVTSEKAQDQTGRPAILHCLSENHSLSSPVFFETGSSRHLNGRRGKENTKPRAPTLQTQPRSHLERMEESGAGPS